MLKHYSLRDRDSFHDVQAAGPIQAWYLLKDKGEVHRISYECWERVGRDWIRIGMVRAGLIRVDFEPLGWEPTWAEIEASRIEAAGLSESARKS